MIGVLRFRGRHSACPRGVAFGLIRQRLFVFQRCGVPAAIGWPGWQHACGYHWYTVEGADIPEAQGAQQAVCVAV